MNNAEVIATLQRCRRAWFDLDGCGEAYLRFNVRDIDGRAVKSIDIANVEVREECRRRGVFSALVAQCEAIALEDARAVVYVEAIHNPHVVEALAKRGYTVRGASPEWTAFKLLGD